jgi:hypothetical protein
MHTAIRGRSLGVLVLVLTCVCVRVCVCVCVQDPVLEQVIKNPQTPEQLIKKATGKSI